ncbi:MAG: methyltransferase domain-containing protein [Candidatus Omnitrophica bacterium]|nr:methyltransferase domain-containing protein [Candidatus Omnitrophota bacterium]
MKRTCRYNPSQWTLPDTQAAVYRQFADRDFIEQNGEKFVLSYTAADILFRRRLVAALRRHLKAKDRVLSVAEGSGHLIRALKRKGIRQIQGVDVCRELVAIGKAKGANLQYADATRLPFKDNSFDVLIINESIGALNLSRTLSEARRVLEPSGRIMITAYDHIEHRQKELNSPVIKYRYVLPGTIMKALKKKRYKKITLESIPIKPIPEELARDGHAGDQVDIISAVKG